MLAHPDDESFGPGGTLARYAAAGVDVHVAIATDGAAGSVAAGYEDRRAELAAVRKEELNTAVSILGVRLHRLGYRDSGYLNDPANEHPHAFVNADETEAVRRVVRLMRQIQPQVVITHDETGGYFHPDHIQCWRVTTEAFHAAGDDSRFPELDLPAYSPQKLYYAAFSNRWVKFFLLLMRLRGHDPTKMGRNQDIDMTSLGVDPQQIHAVIDYRPFWDVKKAASAAHASQGGGGVGRRLPEILQKLLLARDTFIRAYPPAPPGTREKDLFAGVR